MLDMGLPSVCTQAHQCVCVHYVCSLKEHYRGMHLKGHTHIHVVHIKCIRSVRQDITRQGYRVDGLNIRSKIRDRISEIRCWISDSVYLLTRIVCLVDYTCVVHVHVEGIPLVCTVHPLGGVAMQHQVNTRCGSRHTKYQYLEGWSGNPDIRKSDLPIQYPKIRYSDLRDYLVCSHALHVYTTCVP